MVVTSFQQYTVQVLSASIQHNVGKFVLLSSTAVYGMAKLPLTEHSEPIPNTPYGKQIKLK